MTAEKKAHQKWFGGIFEPTYDFYELLNKQADKTLEGMQVLASWLKEDGGDERGQAVRDLEREADELKMDIEQKLSLSFVTPFDREDIFELSASLDEVINSAKGVVREMEAMSVHAQGTKLPELADILVEGTTMLRDAVRALRKDRKAAKELALSARKTDSRSGKKYRVAMQELLQEDDFKKIFRIKEVYKVMLAGADKIDIVGEKILHALVKMD